MSRHVIKLRASVQVSLPDQEPMDGHLWLAPQTQNHDGHQTILERLNAPDRVIPFTCSGDSAVILLTRLDIEWVSAHRAVKNELVCLSPFRVTREEYVRVRLRGGREVTGLLRMELPEQFNRASDFMNGPEDFFPLVTENGVLLVNKLRVQSLRLYEGSPVPIATREEKERG